MKSKAENWIRSRSTQVMSYVPGTREEILFTYTWALWQRRNKWAWSDLSKLLDEAYDTLEYFNHVAKDTSSYLVPVIEERHFPDDYKYAYVSLAKKEPTLLTDAIEACMKEHHESLFKE